MQHREEVVQWLRCARSDFGLLTGAKPEETLWETLCFHAQQTAEKALKAVIIAYSLPPKRTHNIAELIGLIAQHGISLPDAVKEASVLTAYAVEARYPSDVEHATAEEHAAAVLHAKAVLDWAEATVKTARPSSMESMSS